MRILSVGLALLVAAASFANEPELTRSSLEEEIRELRGRGEYESAVAVAEQLVDVAVRAPESWESELIIEEAQKLVETVRWAAELPPERRRILARADSLEAASWRLAREQLPGEAISASEEALVLYRDVLGPDHPEIAYMLHRQAHRKDDTGDLSGAERDYLEAIEVARRAFGPASFQVGSLTGVYAGFLSQSLNEVEKAEALDREALEIIGAWASTGLDNPAGAMFQMNLAAVLIDSGEYPEAIRLLGEAASTWRESDDEAAPYLLLGVLLGLSEAQEEVGELADSEASLREAKSLIEQFFGAGSFQEVEVGVLVDLASIQASRGRLEEAEASLRTALATLRRSARGDDPNIASILDGLASVLKDEGEHGQAEPLLREALALRRRAFGSDHEDVAKSLHHLAWLLDAQGDFLGAEELLRESLAIRRSRGDIDEEVAEGLKNLGAVVGKRGDYAQAEEFMREALAIFRDRGSIKAAECLQGLAAMKWYEGDIEGAELLFEEALEVGRAQRGESWPGDPGIRSGLIALKVALGEYEQAESLSRELVLDLRGSPKRERELAHGLLALGMLLCVRGEHAEAESVLVEAAEVYESARVHAGGGYARATFWGVTPYDQLAGARANLGAAEQAWSAAEKGLSRTLAEFLLSAEMEVMSPAEVARKESLTTAMADQERRVDVCSKAARVDTSRAARERVIRARDELLLTEAAWASLQESIWERQPAAVREPIGFERLQDSLPSDCALIGWIKLFADLRASEPWAYVVRHSGEVSWFRLPAQERRAPTPLIPAETSPFRDNLTSRESPLGGIKHDARDLWRQWFEPMTSALEGVDRLVVVPSAALAGLPVETLIDNEGVLLGERYVVSYTPSATVYEWLSRKRVRAVADGALTGLLVGDPPFASEHVPAGKAGEETPLLLASGEPPASRDMLRSAIGGNDLAIASLPRLHGTRSEVRGVASIVPGCEVLLGTDASEQRLVELAATGALERFDVIHLATHAIVDDESPEKSALVLSQVDQPDPLEAVMAGERVYDGLLTAKDVAREWSLDADIVVLSACNTGLGRKTAGDGYIGLAHAFFQAGARSLLVSLWKVDDVATSLLMRRFYENRFGEYEDERSGIAGEPMSKADALREAKLWLRDSTDEHGNHPYEHPYYWSAFILIGDPS